MNIKDITHETQVEVYSAKVGGAKVVSVHGVRPTGADGPWLGELRLVEGKHLGPAKLWAFFPVLKSDRYQIAQRPAGTEFGKKAAANRLRNLIADRNLSNPV